MMLDKFDPTYPEVLDAMLRLGRTRAGLKHIDLGSGDGQIVKAAQDMGFNSYGIEIDPVLAQQSRDQYGITVLNEDCFNSDVSQADVITCWFSLLPGTDQLMEKLKAEMKKGAVLIKQAYTPSSWEPVNVPTGTLQLLTETFQGKSVFRLSRQIICVYKK